MGIIQTIEGDLGKLFGFLRKEEKALMTEIVGEIKALRADIDALKAKEAPVLASDEAKIRAVVAKILTELGLESPAAPASPPAPPAPEAPATPAAPTP